MQPLNDTIKPEDFLIYHASKIAKSNFMDFPDYEDGLIQDVQTALIVIVQSTVDHKTGFNEAGVYDYFCTVFSKVQS